MTANCIVSTHMNTAIFLNNELKNGILKMNYFFQSRVDK
jgi:hypothetical protein